MPKSSVTETEFAESLVKARRDADLIPSSRIPSPLDEAGAYRILDEAIRARGDEIVGFKLGATNPSAWPELELNGPFLAPITRKDCHASGDGVALVARHHPAIEAEFVVELADDLAPGADPIDANDVLLACASVRTGIEFIGCRLAGGYKGARLGLIADFGATAAVVMGPGMSQAEIRRQHLAWESLSVSVRVNDAKVATGSVAALAWADPFAAVAFAANHPAVQPRGLRAGDVICTGTVSGLIAIDADATVACDFGPFGRITADVRLL